MQQVKDILNVILAEGDDVISRAGSVKRLSHEMVTFDLRNGFPLLTGRKMYTAGIFGELACFVKGLTNIEEFKKRGCNFWDANLEDFNTKCNTPDNRDLGPIYGFQWRNFYDYDQLRKVIDEAKINPSSRRLVVSAWNPPQMRLMALPPCHILFQLSIVDKHLDLCFYMRSVDCALGLPTDIASYALLTHLIANELELVPRRLTGYLADAHIYMQNLEGVEEYIKRPLFPKPRLQLYMQPGQPVETFEPDMAAISMYAYSAPIKMEMAV